MAGTRTGSSGLAARPRAGAHRPRTTDLYRHMYGELQAPSTSWSLAVSRSPEPHRRARGREHRNAERAVRRRATRSSPGHPTNDMSHMTDVGPAATAKLALTSRWRRRPADPLSTAPGRATGHTNAMTGSTSRKASSCPASPSARRTAMTSRSTWSAGRADPRLSTRRSILGQG